jgi:hypothetical protein
MNADYCFWYQQIEKHYGIKLDSHYRTRVRGVIDLLGGPNVADEPDVTVVLLEQVLCDFREESPEIREALKQKHDSEQFMIDLFSKK